MNTLFSLRLINYIEEERVKLKKITCGSIFRSVVRFVNILSIWVLSFSPATIMICQSLPAATFSIIKLRKKMEPEIKNKNILIW
jgi:hypothetical protein